MRTNKKIIEKYKIGCNLYIDTEENEPDIITDITQIIPSKTRIKGAPFVNRLGKEIGGKFNESNLWIYESPTIIDEDGVYLDKTIQSVLDLLDSKKNDFKDIFTRFPKNHLMCFGYYSFNNPYFIFNKGLLKRLTEYQLEVEFDLYFI
jgi:hypothetical protein